MRKITIIISSLIICFICSWSSHAAQVTTNHHHISGLILDNTSIEWSCEREFNSDMGLARLAANAAQSTLTTPSPSSWQGAQRWGVAAGTIYARENAIIRSFLDHKSIIEIQPPVDYYVIELRHLII